MLRPARLTLLTAAAAVPFAMSSQAGAAIVLTVDATDPSAAVISATGAASLIDDTSSDSLAGVTLLDLFAADFDINAFVVGATGDLAANQSEAYESVANDIFSVGLRDLNLFNQLLTNSPQAFSVSAPAFTGSLVVDLTGADLVVGTMGDVIVGDTDLGSGAVIGQFEIVPEPASATLLAIGGGGLFAARRGRRNRK